MEIVFKSSDLKCYANGTFNKAEAFILTYTGTEIPKKARNAPQKVEVPSVTTFEELSQTKSELSELSDPESVKIRKIISANFGAKNEKSVNQLYSEQTGNAITPPKSFTKNFGEFKISGRCDGITTINGIDHIVEIKTRSTNKLGMNWNERAQCLSYCECLGVPGLVFVQQKNNGELVITQVSDFADKYSRTWDMIIDHLAILCEISEKAKQNPEEYIEDNRVIYEKATEMLYWL